jgi:hypothetical protein
MPEDFKLGVLQKFATFICARREDWNGEVLSIRNTDLATVSILLNLDEPATYAWLFSRGLLLNKP